MCYTSMFEWISLQPCNLIRYVDVLVSNMSPDNSVRKSDAEQPERVVVVAGLCFSRQARHAARLHATLLCADCTRRLCQRHTSPGVNCSLSVALMLNELFACVFSTSF